jgi:transcriptional regulator with XRE-family HTH domain
VPPLTVADKKHIALQLGQEVKRLRTGKKLSMQQLATIAEIEKTQIFRIEHGMFDIKLSTLYKLADALDVNVKTLLPDQKKHY